MKIKMKNYARHLWLSLLLLVGVTAIAVPVLNETNESSVAKIGDTEYATLEAAVAAAEDDQTVEILKAGEYAIPAIPKNLTIEATVNGVVVNHTDNAAITTIASGKTATFKNITFNLGTTALATGHGFGTLNGSNGALVMDGCTIDGALNLFGESTFTNCKFNAEGIYNIWALNDNATFTGCTFTNTNRAVNVYDQKKSSTAKNVSFTGCTFTGSALKKAAVNIHHNPDPVGTAAKYAVSITNCTTPGTWASTVEETGEPDEKTICYSPLWMISDIVNWEDGDITVTVDGKDQDVSKFSPVAKIGDTKYATLQAAFDAATDGQTVTLLKDVVATGAMYSDDTRFNLWVKSGITVDGTENNYTITVKGRGIGVQGASGNIDVTFKNITIKNSSAEGRCIDTRGKIGSLTLDNATLSTEGKEASQPLTIGGNQADHATVKILNGSTVATSEDGKYGYAITTFNPVNMTVDGSTIKGWACLNIKAASSSAGSNGSLFNITNSELTSKNVYPGTSNAYSVIKVEDVDVTVNITNTKINVNGDKNSEAIVGFQTSNTKESVVNMGEGNEVTFTGTTDFAHNDNAASKLLISGGIFNQPVPEQNCAEGMIPSDLGNGKYSVKVGSYVAKINEKKYETLEAAFAAAQDGETITLLADCTGNGIKAPQGKFTTGLTVDFAGHTYTVDGTTVGSTGTETNGFQLLKDNKITFKGGTITSKKAKILVQNYSDLTLEGMTLTLDNANYTSAYTLSNNNGKVVIDGTTINANPAGGFAFDVCRYESYPSVNVTVKGKSVINGNIEVFASNKDPKDGFGLTLEAGTFNGNIVLDASAEAVLNATPEKAVIKKSNSLTTVVAPQDYKWKDNGDGTSTLVPCEYVAQYNNVKYETLQAALDAAEADNPQDIVIDLLGDATLDITAWSGTGNSLAIGTESTKSITINGNANKLTFIYKNSDWNNVATMNDAVTKLILNDMAITHQLHPKSGGTWNGFDIGFNCAVELNNVTSDKALAFKNDATLNNVTITETHDYYAIWVSARGQSVSINGLNLTSSGRGIKIDDEYVDNPELTTLNIQNATFNTQKKAAILVKSDANTVITVGENVNIENVAADKTNVVWVDEDRAEEFYKVTVNNATIMPESKETDYVACLMKGEQRWGFYKGTSALSKAIGKVEDGYSIKLFQTTTEAVEVNKPLVITKNGFKADNVTAGEGFKKFETEAEIVIKSFNPVCAIDDEKYESLQEAVNAAGTNAATITLLTDAATDGVITGNGVKVQAGQNITFDLNGLTYNVDKTVGSAGTETNGFQLLKGSTVKFTNGTLTSATAQILLQNYSDLTLDGVTVNAGSADYAVSNNFGSLTVTGETNINAKSGGCAFDLWYGMSDVYDDGISVVFDENFTGSVTGKVEYGHASRVTDENWREKTKLEIKAGKFDIEFVNSSTDALNGANISISGGVFAKKPAEEYCADGYVVVDNEDGATKVQYPYTVKSKEDAGIFEFIDGIVNNTYLTYTTEKDATSITYTRTFKDSHVDKYQSWFIPFDYKITDDDAEKFQFFKVYMVSYSGSSEGGVITEKTKLYIFLEPVTAGTTLKANKPYVVKPSAAFTDYVFKSENVKLLPAPNDNVCLHTETSDTRYNFYGTYVAEFHPSKRYEVLAVNGGQISWIAPKAYIPPYRWYIKPSVNNSSEQYGKITFEFIEEGDATSIEIPTETTDVIEGIYGVNGVKRDYLMPGLNIIKYANGKTKKIFK